MKLRRDSNFSIPSTKEARKTLKNNAREPQKKQITEENATYGIFRTKQATQTNHAIREPENEVEVTQNVTQNIPSTK